MEEKLHTILGEMLYKWAFNPTEHAGYALYQTLIRQIDAQYDKYCDMTKSVPDLPIMTVQNFFISSMYCDLRREIAEKSSDRFFFFCHFSPSGNHPHACGFRDYKNHVNLYMYSSVDRDMMERIPTKMLTFDDIFNYITDGSGMDGRTRCIMLAYEGKDQENVAKTIGIITQSATRCNAIITARSDDEHKALKDKVYKKALNIFNNSNIVLPLWECPDENSTLDHYIQKKLEDTGRLLNEKMKVDALIKESDNDQQ